MCVFLFYDYAYIYVGAQGGKKRLSNPPELGVSDN